MKRMCCVVVLLSAAGCSSAPSDPPENLRWHLAKAFKSHRDGITFVTQTDSERSTRHAGKWQKWVMALGDVDAKFDFESTDSPLSPYTATVSLTPKTVDYEYCNSREEAEKTTNIRQSHKSFTYKAAYKYDGTKWELTGIECHVISRSGERDVPIPPEAEGRLYRVLGAVK